MSEAKFTKGKWSASCVKVNGKEVRNGWGVDVGGFTLASVYTGPTFGVVHEQQKANAHLIAAAPELYGLLEEMADYDECQRFKKQINQLLAKARGES